MAARIRFSLFVEEGLEVGAHRLAANKPETFLCMDTESAFCTIHFKDAAAMIALGASIERKGRELAGQMEVVRQMSNQEAAAFIGEPLPAA